MKTCKKCKEETCKQSAKYCFQHLLEHQQELRNKSVKKSIAKQKTKPKKKKVKTEQQQVEALRKRCVNLAKQINKIQSNYTCQYCGVDRTKKQIHSHHIFHEGLHKSMSADLDNLICLCASHHQSFAGSRNSFSFHACPTESTEWLINNIPKQYEEIRKRSIKTQKCDKLFWENKLKELKEYESNLV